MIREKTPDSRRRIGGKDSCLLPLQTCGEPTLECLKESDAFNHSQLSSSDGSGNRCVVRKGWQTADKLNALQPFRTPCRRETLP